MVSKSVIGMAVAAGVALAPVQQAAADGADIVGGIIGGMIGGAIMNNQRQQPRTQTRTVYRTAKPSPARAQTRELQTSLNYFGFPAGSPDGVMGSRTRSAVSSYQAFMAFPVTGTLNEYERSVLVGAYHRGTSGAADAMRLVSTSPLGAKALLKAQRDIMSGGTVAAVEVPKAGYSGLPIEVSQAVDEVAESSDPSAEQLLQRSGFIQLADLNGDGRTDYILDTSYSGSSYWCGANQCQTMVFVSTSNGYARNNMLASNPVPANFSCSGATCSIAQTPIPAAAPAAPMPTPAPATETPGTVMAALPLLPTTGLASAKPTLGSHCSKVSLLTNANGGFVTLATMGEPMLVLNEQFCLARAFSMEVSDQMGQALQGVSAAQVAQMCGQYGPALKPYAASIAIKPRDEVLRDVGAFVLNSGLDAAQLSGTAKICLGTGYRTEDMDVAIGSALLLSAMGEAPYGELLGHHLALGFGAPERADMATAWYDGATSAISGGAAAVFAPGQPERVNLIQAAAVQLGGGGTMPQPVEASVGLPTFQISE
ncbi:peptidoglycan-binding domain-containing protein [Poseidonocella pacifica]|nr:peptidoglycan-binding domain-containing protein [Poseidonocella pacifica]